VPQLGKSIVALRFELALFCFKSGIAATSLIPAGRGME
jgi:hypothetical protein